LAVLVHPALATSQHQLPGDELRCIAWTILGFGNQLRCPVDGEDILDLFAVDEELGQESIAPFFQGITHPIQIDRLIDGQSRRHQQSQATMADILLAEKNIVGDRG
jgi:hypothetical protein